MPKKTTGAETPPPEDEEIFPEETEEAPEEEESGDPDSAEGDDADKGEAPAKEERLRDLIFREFAKRDQANQVFQSQVAAGFGELKGMLQREPPTNGGPGPHTTQEDEAELTNEQVQQLIEAGRGADAFRYLARAENKKAMNQAVRQAQASFSESQIRTQATNELYREFPELKNAGHPFTARTNEIYVDLAAPFGGHAAIDGTPLQVQLAARAAERAARLHGDLRESEQQRSRRTRSATDTASALSGGLPLSRGKPPKAPAFTRDDLTIAARFGVKLDDPKVRKVIQANKQHYEKLRVEPRHPLGESDE
jgi:hypothetical protein